MRQKRSCFFHHGDTGREKKSQRFRLTSDIAMCYYFAPWDTLPKCRSSSERTRLGNTISSARHPWRKPWSWIRVRRSTGLSRIATLWFYGVSRNRKASCGVESMGSEQAALPGLALAQETHSPADESASSKEGKGERAPKPRFQEIDRKQLFWRTVDVERLIPDDHPARAIWEFVGNLDLSGYTVQIRAVEGMAGRPALNPQLLISLWVYAYSQGVGSARAIEKLCENDPPYQWLTGMEVVNAHS